MHTARVPKRIRALKFFVGPGLNPGRLLDRRVLYPLRCAPLASGSQRQQLVSWDVLFRHVRGGRVEHRQEQDRPDRGLLGAVAERHPEHQPRREPRP